MKRYQNRDPEKSYNVQSWASPIDVAKLIEATENWTGEKSINMSEVIRLALQIAAIATGNYQRETKDMSTIEDAFNYIEMKGFTMHQRTDRRRHIVGRALATEDAKLENIEFRGRPQYSDAGQFLASVVELTRSGMSREEAMDKADPTYIHHRRPDEQQEYISGVGAPKTPDAFDKSAFAGPTMVKISPKANE